MTTHKPSAANIVLILLVLSCIGFMSTGPRAADDAKSVVQKWEYLAAPNADAAQLNEHGKRGWEAFAVVQKDYDTRLTYFKRPAKQ